MISEALAVRLPEWTPWPSARTLYPPAVPGGIVLQLSRTDDDGQVVEVVQCPPVETPGQAMRSMRRTAAAYGVLMTTRSRLSVELWRDDGEELYAALAALSNRLTYRRSWMLRNGHVLTLSVGPADDAEALPAVGTLPDQREVPQ